MTAQPDVVGSAVGNSNFNKEDKQKSDDDRFVLGLDLDGCVANFNEIMRDIYSEWRELDVDSVTDSPTYGFPEWGLNKPDYVRLHRFAVTQKDLFEKIKPVSGAVPALNRLSVEGVRIRIATHRLFIPYFHEQAVSQTVRWLDIHGIPYWDLCFIEDKSSVAADIFVEDTFKNLQRLHDYGRSPNRNPVRTICFTNSTNSKYVAPDLRADSWDEAESLIREHHNQWRGARGKKLVTEIGRAPEGEDYKLPNDEEFGN